jgi:MFS-type transporter involved in bile tolerance (Atg22 family)
VNRIQSLFAGVARLLKVRADVEDEVRDTSQRKTLLANFGAIVLNGLFFPTAGKILGAGLLLAWFLDELKSPLFLIGLLIPIQYGLALLAQPWIGQWLSGKPRSAPYYRAQALLRGALWCSLGLATWLAGNSNRVLLISIFFFVVAGDAIAAGLGNIAFSNALAKTIPQRMRGRVRGGRGMFGAIIAGTAGALISLFVSKESGLGVFALLFAVAGACYALGGITFGTIQEPRQPQRRESHSAESLVASVKEMLLKQAYRRFLFVEALLIPATQGLVFFSIFGRRQFHLDLSALGLLVISDALAPLVGNFLWGKLADRQSNRLVLGAVALLSLISPLAAVALYISSEAISHTLMLATFAVIVFVIGVASAGADLATKNLLLELAPDRKRPVYIGVNDTLVALPTMLLVIGGPAIDWFGFLPVFIVMGLFGLGAATVSVTLPQSQR